MGTLSLVVSVWVCLFVVLFVCWGERGGRLVVISVFVYLVVLFMLCKLEGRDRVCLLRISF